MADSFALVSTTPHNGKSLANDVTLYGYFGLHLMIAKSVELDMVDECFAVAHRKGIAVSSSAPDCVFAG